MLASLLVVPASFGALALLDDPSDGVQLAVVLGVMAVYVGLLVLGVRRWATYAMRLEVTRAGVREETGAEDARQVREVPWSEVRDYVLTEYPNGARTLTIRPRTGRKIAVAQGPGEEERAAFGTFRDAFLAGVRAYRPAPGGEPIWARPSFFDGPVARVLAGGAVVAIAGLVVLVLTSGRPVGAADWLRLAMVAGLLLPLVVRVFMGPGRESMEGSSTSNRSRG